MRLPNTTSLAFLLLLLFGGCATRPINPPITHVDPAAGYRFTTRPQYSTDNEDLVILAFSGGGTRAAAFSYGVLEFLRNTEVVGPKGNRTRLLDNVGIISGVSGGSFTALAYGLYGDKLFDDYEQRFLKRDVQREITWRTLNPARWPSLWSRGWGRSELAADLYDEILFNGATFGDINRGKGPFIVASATDISTGTSVPFAQGTFDVLCSDLSAVPLSRAAAASSAVPVVLSPVTLNNYGGTCGYMPPAWLKPFVDTDNPPRPAARTTRHMTEQAEFEDSANRPYIHLVDGGISDNLGMRSVLDALEIMETLYSIDQPTPFDRIHRIVVFVVNSLSSPKTQWDKSESPPGTVPILLKAAGVPIDHYSYEATELLKDTEAQWESMRQLRESPAFIRSTDTKLVADLRTPNATIYTIDVSFNRLTDKAERDYLNELPTSFALPPEAVDRLRAAATKIIKVSPEFQRLLRDVRAEVVTQPQREGPQAGTPPTR
ncbi:Patatin-like phospholipase [Caballeronia arationis]|jgi:NTE family protein|uniref:Predicted acylesterase/phospholipase RssA, contains patatin domain n=1 Tax=Caballeronia arationis TaxID=1777142 RepID=A0A7Z7I6F6_9BURK|nr:patatin-like phospholipase family protein [Caballeronia arationis]SAL06251.1 Patatin-like phospholipase [Caballeronia arationis]SOE66936.1 Predicted acylesterase/phospholipase RssA, contains patatin domain [Caballeronia arationis]